MLYGVVSLTTERNILYVVVRVVPNSFKLLGSDYEINKTITQKLDEIEDMKTESKVKLTSCI